MKKLLCVLFFLQITSTCGDTREETEECPFSREETRAIQLEARRKDRLLRNEMALELQNNPERYRCTQDTDCGLISHDICFYDTCPVPGSLPRRLQDQYRDRYIEIHQECINKPGGEECAERLSPPYLNCPAVYYGDAVCVEGRCSRDGLQPPVREPPLEEE